MTTAVMQYAISKVKMFRGMEGEGFNAALLRDGKAVCDIINEGNGGCFNYLWRDGRDGAEARLWNEYVEAQRAQIPADKPAPYGGSARDLFCSDILMEDMVLKVADDRRFRRMCQKNTVFQAGDAIGGPVFTSIKGHGPDVRAFIERKHAGKKVRYLNDEYGIPAQNA